MSKSTKLNDNNEHQQNNDDGPTIHQKTAPEGNYISFDQGNMYLMGRDIDFVGDRAAAATTIGNGGSSEIDNVAETKQSAVKVGNGLEQMSYFNIPPTSLLKREERDGRHYHLTLLTRAEIQQAEIPFGRKSSDIDEKKESCTTSTVDTSQIASVPNTSTTTTMSNVKIFCQTFFGTKELLLGRDWYILGLGQDPSHQCYFLVVCFPKGIALRNRLGLPPKDFHITIAFEEKDIHNCDKGLTSLFRLQPPSLVGITSSPLDLIDAAQQFYLGGTPNISAKKKKKSDYQAASVLLQASEVIFVNQTLDGQPIGKSILKSLDVSQLQLVYKISMLQCQLMGRKGEYESMLVLTEFILGVQEMLTEERSKSQHITRDDAEESRQIEASVLGYKGFSFATTKRWSDALPYLTKSYELRSKKVKGGMSDKPEFVTLLDKKRADEAIIVERALATCCQSLGIQAPLPPLTTFPRTAHLFDSGGTAVTSDDLIMSGDSSLFCIIGDGKTEVIVEEKIDGANMGFSLSASGEIIAQNRNHFISSGDHSQFGPLSGWIEENRSSLVHILKPSSDHKQRSASQGLVLFGEWMVAKHSIPYHKLPGRFVAFDLYDRLEKKFYSRSQFHAILSGTCIPCVPVIAVRTFGPYPKHVFSAKVGQKNTNPFEKELRMLLETRSKFRTDGGFVEGVVLRIDQNPDEGQQHSKWLKHRAKIVRPDFVRGCQNGHWMRNNIEKQTVDELFANEYMSTANSYCLAPVENCALKTFKNDITIQYKDGEPITDIKLIKPRRRILVEYAHNEGVLFPHNFSFMWIDKIALSSAPLDEAHISASKSVFNISLIITLTEEPLPSSWFHNEDGCDNKHFPIQNLMPPNLEQINDIVHNAVKTVQSGSAVLIHCGCGNGRTGTVAACLLLKFGLAGIRASLDQLASDAGSLLSSDAAIEHIRSTRPGSIETNSQEEFIRDYSRELKIGAASISPEGSIKDSVGLLPSKLPPALKKATTKAEKEHLAQKKRAQRRAPRCVILMGLPGSGKSTFSARLAENSCTEPWIVINQDKLGKKACEQLVGCKAKSKANRVILDRCNSTAAEREYWLELMHSPPKGEISLVYFSANFKTCTSRVERRENHETIPKGRGAKIVESISQKFEPPTLKEKNRFGSVHIVETFEDANNLLCTWGFE